MMKWSMQTGRSDEMHIVLWILVIACFVFSFVALIRPIIPGMPILWLGFLIYHYGINHWKLTISFWVILVLFTVFIFVVDIVVNKYFLQKHGSTKWGERIGMLSVIIGSFIIPPFGLIIVPFLAVFLTEKVQGKDLIQAVKVAWATVLSFLSSSLAKAILQVIIIVIFMGYVIL